MDDREYARRKQRSDTIWTFLIIAAFLAAWPVGVVLAIFKWRNRLPNIGMGVPGGREEWRQATTDWEAKAKEQTQRAKARAQEWSEKYRQVNDTPASAPKEGHYQEVKWAVPVQKQKKLRFGKGMFIAGICTAFVGAVSFTDALAQIDSFGSFLRRGSFPFGIFAVGIFLIASGYLRMKQSKRLQMFSTLITPNETYYSVHELADRTGYPFRQVMADLQKMLELGIWPQAWLDRKHGRLMFTPYSPEQIVQEQPKEASSSRAEQVLHEIRHDNDLIADPVISQKIDRIELLTGEIFRYVEKHPEREGELRTFMNYYLPQTLKILETYAQLEAQGVETENIRKAKAEISGLLDQLTTSYEKQLDRLFASDVVDISADIAVMQQMLRSEGLSPDDLELELSRYRKGE